MSLLNQEIKIKLEAAPGQEAKREVMKQVLEDKLGKFNEQLKKSPAAQESFEKGVQEDLKGLSLVEDKDQKVNVLLKIAEADPYRSVVVVYESKDPYLEDAFHDHLIENYDDLVAKGQLENL